jgi:hypothetical protein
MEHLRTHGFVVIPSGIQEIREYRQDLLEEVRNFKEFKEPPTPNDLGLGGFCALANPSSFHNPTVRKIRARVHSLVLETLRNLVPPSDGWKFEQVIDRMLVRPPNRVVGRETWHRDVAENANDLDMVFGGWINLDPEVQYFSCVPGTHTEVATNRGYAKIEDREMINRYNRSRVSVEVPEGHIIIFYEKIVHEVNRRQANDLIVRLFLGWRITRESTSLDSDTLERLRNQAIIMIKSGKNPYLYTSYEYKADRIGRLVAFSEKFHDVCKKSFNSRHIGVFMKVDQNMRSLMEYGLPMYEPYTEAEIRMHIPQPI